MLKFVTEGRVTLYGMELTSSQLLIFFSPKNNVCDNFGIVASVYIETSISDPFPSISSHCEHIFLCIML